MTNSKLSYDFKIKGLVQKPTKTLEVIISPKDLPNLLTYNDAVKAVAALKDFHGHDGCNFADDAEFFAALENGTYNGGWFIPPKDLLLEMHKNRDALGGFKTEYRSSGLGHWYWSSTEARGTPDCVWNVRITDGYADWLSKDAHRLSVRPVRLDGLSIQPFNNLNSSSIGEVE